jgi:copper transport protein
VVIHRLAPVLCALMALAMLPANAFAHAQLEGTSPQRGQVVAKQPAQVMFRFDETVEGNFGAVRVYDGKGARADQGDAFHPNRVGKQMAVHLKPNLPAGTYTATYRVVSADGHVVSSGFAFSIGRASATSQTVGALIAGAGSAPLTSTAFAAARALVFAAIAVALGLFGFLVLVWPAALRSASAAPEWLDASHAVVARIRRIALGAAFAGAFAAGAAVVLEGADAAGISGFSAVKPSVVHETLGTRFGTYWGLAVIAWAAVAVLAIAALGRVRSEHFVLGEAELGATGLAPTAAPPRLGVVAAGLPLAFLAALPALGGHAASQHPAWLLVPTNVAHVIAMGIWTGGLVALLFALPAGTRLLEPSERTRILAAAVVRFSLIALTAVLVLSGTGAIQGIVWVHTPAHLLDTAYGRAVLIKVVLLTALVLLGALNRQRTVPRLQAAAERGDTPGRTGLLLRRTLRAEVALIVVVLAVTGALSGYPPSIDANTGPVSRTARVGPASLELTVDPARVGSNQIHLYLLNPKTGAQYDGAKEVTVNAAQPEQQIGPLKETAHRAGPGHYIVQSAVLGVPGKWQLTIAVRVSEFDQYLARVEVRIR